MGRDLLNEDNVGRLSLTSKIFNVIRDDILHGKYTEGEKLVEAKLAEELGVSRTPVREALKQLELDGIVENIPNRGVVVKGITKQDIQDIFTIRRAIEGIAATWAVERITDQELQDLKETYELMEFYAFKKDKDKFAEQNTRFHETIYKATKSRYLEQVLKDFQYYVKQTRKKSLENEGRMPHALEEHKAILDAFLDRDKERAEKALTVHVNNSMKNVENTSK
ncbi:DNA-binding GntR family transcriptional regulator [Anaerosolibacter carboniphilus]|uniref:DNA-binding GntR family transcriptional regulator n=1 Tax=Anaerosolibacter carboniphilus TaxID=1417629 RepID=A0A841L5P7_9FIRM|nr:GntR family transcriptional regulator [Anaerosolibacter carboniphilus]MBB6218432.1 DNA-binding GntR family transcriptional regulator [Anaerosolibacter carboniphilus]